MSSSKPCLGAWQINVQRPVADAQLLFLWGVAYLVGGYAIVCSGLILATKLLAAAILTVLFLRAWRRRLQVSDLRMTPAVLRLEMANEKTHTLLPPWFAIVTPWFVLLDVPLARGRCSQILLVRSRMSPEQWRVLCTLLRLKRRHQS